MQSFIDTRRYRGVFAVAGSVVLAIVMMNSLLLLAFGQSPRWLVPIQKPMAWPQIEDATYVAEALAGNATAQSSADHRFLLYLGLSTAREGIEPDGLSRDCPKFDGVCGICGSGQSMDNLRSLAEPLIRKRIRPGLTLLCIHVSWLVGNPTAVARGGNADTGTARKSSLAGVKESLTQLDWIRINRDYMNYAIRSWLFEVREKLHINRNDRIPWTAPKRLGYPLHASEKYLAIQTQAFERYGWFDEQRYRGYQDAQADALVNLVTDFRALGSDVAIVLMPEQSVVRDRVPADARDYLRQRIADGAKVDPPVIWSFVDALSDDLFTDLCHLNDDGRDVFTRLLARELGQYCAKEQVAN